MEVVRRMRDINFIFHFKNTICDKSYINPIKKEERKNINQRSIIMHQIFVEVQNNFSELMKKFSPILKIRRRRWRSLRIRKVAVTMSNKHIDEDIKKGTIKRG